MEIKKTLSDGRVETFKPHRYADGFYRVQVKVKDLAEVERLARDGNEVRVRGDIHGKYNLSKMV